MPIIGAAYLRCSDPRQDKSIEQQREEIERRCATEGVVIPPENWFVDEGLSGRTADKRSVERHRKRQRGEGLFGLDHDLRSDTVASQQQDLHVRRPFLSLRAA